jgi:hypothetical protein
MGRHTRPADLVCQYDLGVARHIQAPSHGDKRSALAVCAASPPTRCTQGFCKGTIAKPTLQSPNNKASRSLWHTLLGVAKTFPGPIDKSIMYGVQTAGIWPNRQRRGLFGVHFEAPRSVKNWRWKHVSETTDQPTVTARPDDFWSHPRVPSKILGASLVPLGARSSSPLRGDHFIVQGSVWSPGAASKILPEDAGASGAPACCQVRKRIHHRGDVHRTHSEHICQAHSHDRAAVGFGDAAATPHPTLRETGKTSIVLEVIFNM